jgi:hypothetical protein
VKSDSKSINAEIHLEYDLQKVLTDDGTTTQSINPKYRIIE